MEKLTNVGSALGKDIINLEDGAIVGSIQGALIDMDTRKVVGFKMKQKGILGSKNILCFSNVRSIGEHMVTVSSLEGTASGKDIRNMGVITADGTFLGKVVDFAFDKDGLIYEFILKDGIMKGLPKDRGAVLSSDIITIGKDMIIAKEGMANNEFVISDEEIYGDWEEIDEILEDIDDDDDTDIDSDDEVKENGKTYEEQFDEVTDKIGKTINEVGAKLKEIDTEELSGKIKTQSKRIGNEAKEFWGSFKDRFNKTNVKEDLSAIDLDELYQSLKGATVEKPLLDDEGNVILWPAQEVDKAIIEQVIKAGKLAELKDLLVTKADNVAEAVVTEVADIAEEAIMEEVVEENQDK